jgi:hypothetical protein
MAKFRKKPVVIEAVRFPVDGIMTQELIDFLGMTFQALPGEGYNHITISTLEGNMEASPGDWIIKGVNGEKYPCKPDIFEKTYEAVEEADHE